MTGDKRFSVNTRIKIEVQNKDMAESIKTVTDRSQFPTLFNNLFSGENVFLRTRSGDLKIHYLGYSSDNVAFRIPRVKSVPEKVIVQTMTQTSTIYASLKYIENSEDTFVFLPVKVQIIIQSRREDRKLLNIEGGGKNIIYISNIMSDFNIKNSLSMSDKKIDNVKEITEFDLQKQFELIRIVFMNEFKNEFRAPHLFNDKKIIMIYNLNEAPDPKHENEYNYYINNIYSRDYSLSRQNKYISEASVPIYYRGIIPYGYVQVNNTKPMTDGHLAVVKRTAVVINELLKKDRVLEPINTRVLVSDISKGGLSIVFRERRMVSNFIQGSLACFDMMLPTRKKATIGATVRNVQFLENSVIKVGMEITYIDAISEVNYDEFLDSRTDGES